LQVTLVSSGIIFAGLVAAVGLKLLGREVRYRPVSQVFKKDLAEMSQHQDTELAI
jgi:hypothetical protein